MKLSSTEYEIICFLWDLLCIVSVKFWIFERLLGSLQCSSYVAFCVPGRLPHQGLLYSKNTHFAVFDEISVKVNSESIVVVEDIAIVHRL